MMTNKERVLAIGKYIATLQRDYHALRAVVEPIQISTSDGPKPFDWRSRMKLMAQQESFQEIASVPIRELQQAIAHNALDSDLIAVLHQQFLQEE